MQVPLSSSLSLSQVCQAASAKNRASTPSSSIASSAGARSICVGLPARRKNSPGTSSKRRDPSHEDPLVKGIGFGRPASSGGTRPCWRPAGPTTPRHSVPKEATQRGSATCMRSPRTSSTQFMADPTSRAADPPSNLPSHNSVRPQHQDSVVVTSQKTACSTSSDRSLSASRRQLYLGSSEKHEKTDSESAACRNPGSEASKMDCAQQGCPDAQLDLLVGQGSSQISAQELDAVVAALAEVGGHEVNSARVERAEASPSAATTAGTSSMSSGRTSSPTAPRVAHIQHERLKAAYATIAAQRKQAEARLSARELELRRRAEVLRHYSQLSAKRENTSSPIRAPSTEGSPRLRQGPNMSSHRATSPRSPRNAETNNATQRSHGVHVQSQETKSVEGLTQAREFLDDLRRQVTAQTTSQGLGSERKPHAASGHGIRHSRSASARSLLSGSPGTFRAQGSSVSRTSCPSGVRSQTALVSPSFHVPDPSAEVCSSPRDVFQGMSHEAMDALAHISRHVALNTDVTVEEVQHRLWQRIAVVLQQTTQPPTKPE